MEILFAMPKLGMTMTEGKIILVAGAGGRTGRKRGLYFETETDKTSLEVDSLYSGKLLKIYYEEGSTVPVNETGCIYRRGREEIPELPAPQEPVKQDEKAKRDTCCYGNAQAKTCK